MVKKVSSLFLILAYICIISAFININTIIR